MDRLYVMGFTPDLKGVVLASRRGAKKPTHSVDVDDKFMAALAKLEKARATEARNQRTKGRATEIEIPGNGRPLPPVGRSQPRSGLSAAEIQQMLRAGRSTKSVAAAAKTSLQWVERLAEPVMTERDGVVRLARRAYMIRPRLGAAGLQLGEAVLKNLEDRRATPGTIDTLDDAWDARTVAGGWRVRLRIDHRGKKRSAEWDYNKGSRSISPRNRLASQLGWWAPEPTAIEEPPPIDGEVDELNEEVAPAPRRPAAKRKPAKRKPAKRRSPAAPKRKAPAKAKGRAKAKPRARSRPARRR